MPREDVRNANIAVTTTQSLAAPLVHVGQRSLIVFTNTSTAGETITISVGKEATTLAGIVLTGFGSSWSESIDSGFQPSNLEYYVVASAVTATCAIHERIRA